MESTILGVVLDSSVLIAAERARLPTPDLIKTIRPAIGDLPIIVSALTIAEVGHGIYRAKTPERSQERGRFLDEFKAQFRSIQ